MKSKKVFKILSKSSLVLFYFCILSGIITLLFESLYVWNPGCCSLPNFEPVFSYIDISFYQQPELYHDKSFRLLYLATNFTLFLLVTLFFWYMYKLLKNISKNSLFMYENVSILFKLGVTIIVVGSATTYLEGVLLSKALSALYVSNAEVVFSNLSYMDWIFNGIVLIIIAAALKTAVHAVEENKKTI